MHLTLECMPAYKHRKNISHVKVRSVLLCVLLCNLKWWLVHTFKDCAFTCQKCSTNRKVAVRTVRIILRFKACIPKVFHTVIWSCNQSIKIPVHQKSNYLYSIQKLKVCLDFWLIRETYIMLTVFKWQNSNCRWCLNTEYFSPAQQFHGMHTSKQMPIEE